MSSRRIRKKTSKKAKSNQRAIVSPDAQLRQGLDALKAGQLEDAIRQGFKGSGIDLMRENNGESKRARNPFPYNTPDAATRIE